MPYEWFLKLIGFGLAGALLFAPLSVDYQDKNLSVSGVLQSPMTDEITRLVKAHYLFDIEYYASVMIKNKTVYSQTFLKRLSFENDDFYINQKVVSQHNLQAEMGRFKLLFQNIVLSPQDEVVIFVKAKILKNEAFSQATKLETGVLWNYSTPVRKEIYVFDGEKLVLK